MRHHTRFGRHPSTRSTNLRGRTSASSGDRRDSSGAGCAPVGPGTGGGAGSQRPAVTAHGQQAACAVRRSASGQCTAAPTRINQFDTSCGGQKPAGGRATDRMSLTAHGTRSAGGARLQALIYRGRCRSRSAARRGRWRLSADTPGRARSRSTRPSRHVDSRPWGQVADRCGTQAATPVSGQGALAQDLARCPWWCAPSSR